MFFFHSKFVFGSPLLPIKNVSKTIHKQAVFKEAIYLGSPLTYQELEQKLSKSKIDNDNANLTLIKNKFRMSIRSTPYGIFSGCSTGSWGKANRIILNTSGYRRRTRLDLNFLNSIAQEIASQPEIIKYLSVFPNTSIYQINDKVRFIEYEYNHSKREYSLSEIENISYIEKVLQWTSKGARVIKLASLLAEEAHVSINEALNYIHKLVKDQILVTELDAIVTGPDYLNFLIKKLESLNIKETTNYLTVLKEVRKQLKKIDLLIGNNIDTYKSLLFYLDKINVKYNPDQIFQTYLYKHCSVAKIDKKIQSDILSAIEFLNKLYWNNKADNFEAFKIEFTKKYNDAEISLAHLFDPEYGITYGKNVQNAQPTSIDDLNYPNEYKWRTTTEQYLKNKLIKARKKHSYKVKLYDKEVNDITDYNLNFPDTLAVVFQVINPVKTTIVLKRIGGTSAANLLGRFAFGDKEIHKIIEDIIHHEQRVNFPKITAEIVHLAESKKGNIMSRPAFRKHEIPYLAQSISKKENLIYVKDIFVSIRDNKIVLTSRKLNTEIIPKLYTAHNYKFNSLPVYEFLCDLQNQNFDKLDLRFDWGPLRSEFKFLPRVEYKGIILSLAQWKLNNEDYKELLSDKIKNGLIKHCWTWRTKWLIPSKVFLYDEEDNELLIDFKKQTSIQMFLNVLVNRPVIRLKEFVFSQKKSLVVDEKGKPYINEVVAVLLKK